jgi:two-component system sensor histidine kinase VicK
LSHEIKTPITAIKCYLEGMDDGVIENSPKNYVLLHKEINRLIDITSSIMEYEKLEQTEGEALEKYPIDFIKVIQYIQEEYGPLLAKQHQEIIVKQNKIPLICSLDEGKFIQLLHNIFSNFIKYAGIEKVLRISSIERQGKVYVTFQDNGNGVAKKEIEFIREKFYQVDKSRTASIDRGI